jgi:hypothetical protein
MRTKFWSENLEGEDLGKYGGGFGLDASGSVAGPCKHDNEPSVSIRGGEFLDWLSDY